MFRGYMYSVVKRFLGSIPALMLIASVFAMIHANVPSLLPLLLFRPLSNAGLRIDRQSMNFNKDARGV